MNGSNESIKYMTLHSHYRREKVRK